ncbi:TetR/AcrR family transcriptional regulator [Prauserella sp. ASG 168]|uniref:TetR/AcrR family transcriptional regulator n=1 Tax=Prauserella cavernicola TaxID=2800127 RepID=A0A934QUY3_9PSEU|nr:TetR/AcrR family transcriptional regulator [Prauserella cavernicola]MBK1786796.1 TetR/AcrR family transcriptional regulator [Prauserella cavernicola]
MQASAELFRRNGYTGTGLKQITTEAQAPFGSLYHFFPGGKEQLGDEVIRSSGMLYTQLFDIYLTPAPDLVSGIESTFAGAGETLVETGYADACPIATVALEVASTNERLREATADVFTAWIDKGTETFARFGLSAEDARALTIAVVTSLEGAFVLCRSLRSTEPMAAASATVVARARELQAG